VVESPPESDAILEVKNILFIIIIIIIIIIFGV
jgi:hypothetical protein